MDPVAERVARNDSTFRAANEQILAAAESAAVSEIPFICECADPACTSLVRMSRHEYERIRANPRRFLNVPGHEASAQGYAQVVEQHGSYVVVEKLDAAAAIVERLDPRRELR